jgi:plasmid stabilization system protein ParE
MRAVRFLEEAGEELRLASRDHEQQQRGSGRAFLSKVREVTDRLARYPESAPAIREGIRKASVRPFSYSLIYRIEPNAIEVIAVMHQRRDPEYWIDRL